MKTRIFFYGIILVFISCVKSKSESLDIEVDLYTSVDDKPFINSTRPLQFMDSIPTEFKGLINKDSSFLMKLNTVSFRDLSENIKIPDSLRTSIYALSGFNKGKQYYVLDLNGNKNFDDDEIVEFDIGITDNKDYREYFDIHSIEMTMLEANNLQTRPVYFQFLPAPNYFIYEQETEKQKFQHSLQLVAREHSFLYGTFKVNDIEFGVGVNKGLYGYEFIFKKTDTIFLSKNHQSFAKHVVNDTVKLNDTYFTIDSLSGNPLQITLRKIEVEGLHYGFRTNEFSKNYQITSLDGRKTTMKDLVVEKSYILLDFWGTWCAPCKELTPELVQLNKKHGDKIQFVSLAFEMDPQPVKEYVAENGMNWYNGIIKGKPKSGDMSSPVIRGLRIECYPTFIVLDSNLKILFRACGGGDNFLSLKTFLDTEL